MTEEKAKRTPRVGGHSPRGGRLRWSLDRSGSELVLAVRQGREGVTFALHERSAAALYASLFAAVSDDAGAFGTDFETSGALELTRGEGS